MADINRRMGAGTISSIDPGVGTEEITGSAQTFDPTGRAIHVDTAGTVTGQLLEDTEDHTFTFAAGSFAYAFKSITSVGGGFAGKIIR